MPTHKRYAVYLHRPCGFIALFKKKKKKNSVSASLKSPSWMEQQPGSKPRDKEKKGKEKKRKEKKKEKK